MPVSAIFLILESRHSEAWLAGAVVEVSGRGVKWCWSQIVASGKWPRPAYGEVTAPNHSLGVAMFTDMWRDMCVGMFIEEAERHVCRYVHRCVCRRVYRNLYGNVDRYVA